MAKATKVAVKKEHVMAIMKEAGWGDVDEKSKEWFEDKLPSLKDVIPEDFTPADDDVNVTLQTIYTAIDEGAEFEVEGDWPELPGTDNKEAKKGKGKKEPKEAKAGKTDEEKAAEKAAKEAEKAKKKAEREAERAKKKAEQEAAKGPQIPGVRPTKGRPYCAGVVLNKHGLEGGVTDEIVKEVDEMSGKTNMKESAAWAKIAWQVLNGYEQAVPVEDE